MNANDENLGMLIEAWKLMVGRLPGSTIEHSDGVATIFAHVPLPFFNISTIDRPIGTSEELGRRLETVQTRADACAHPSLLALGESWVPEDWSAASAEAGWAPIMSLTWMTADMLLPPRHPAPALEIRRVSDAATATDLATINGLAYGMPVEMFECICNLDLWHEDSYAFVGYSGAHAVAAAATLPVAGTMYVALVATLPEARGKGFAEAVMRRAIEAGRATMGSARMTLHASDMGRPVYSAMGFAAGSRLSLLAQANSAHS